MQDEEGRKVAIGTSMTMEKMVTTPAWLAGFLKPAYFDECHEHIHTNAKDQSSKKGDRNYYCVGCMTGPICDTGRQLDHAGHRVLQVRMASHTNCVRSDDVSTLLDVTHIQTYSINSAKIVFLPSRPQAKPAKGSPCYCEMCNRSLLDKVRFCSLSCKLKAILANPSDTSLTLIPGSAPGKARSGSFQGASLNAEMDGSTISSGDHESPASDVPAGLSPMTPPPKKRIRSTNSKKSNSNKYSPMQQEDERPMKNLKLNRQSAPGLEMLQYLMPLSPTSVLNQQPHLPESSSPAATLETESTTSQHSFPEVAIPEVSMSFRKRSRKSAPIRSHGVGITTTLTY